MTKIKLFNDVCVLVRCTGFKLTTQQINILRNWINEGETDRDTLADAIVCC